MAGLPEKFEQTIRSNLGDEFPHYLRSMGEPTPVSIRTHPLKLSLMNGASSVPWSHFGKYLPSRPVFTLDPLFHAGTYYVQEASSMFLEQALKQTTDLSQPLKVLDLCAAPGGKSTHILSLISRDSLLVSNETIRSRANILVENVQKWGYPNAVVTSDDPADFRKLQGFFDVIVVDAPCSGEGLFRKEPLAMKEWSPENVQRCASRQKRIITDVWNALKKDGMFIYCTCTYNNIENEGNLKWLLEQHNVEFMKITTDPAWGVQEVDDGDVIGYRFFPHRLKGEGFFLSAMRKREEVSETPLRTKKAIAGPSVKIEEKLRPWISNTGANRFFQFNDFVFYTPLSVSEPVEFLLQSLKIVYAGTNIATIKHEKCIPEHPFALSNELERNSFNVIEVDETEALRYLRRENIHLANTATGFALLTHAGVPLGWVNILSNRTNNMYPSHWRIRM